MTATIVFLCNKQEANIILQVSICCNKTLIVDNLDFIYELNILRPTASDENKRKYPIEFICALTVTNKERDF
jgi:hypothetical protein